MTSKFKKKKIREIGRKVMTVYAKQLAGWTFQDVVMNPGKDNAYVITAQEREKMAFDAVKRTHPEFDMTEFRRMVAEIRQKNKQKEEKFWE